MVKAYSAPRVFTGDSWLKDHSVIIKDNVIIDILPAKDLGPEIKQESFPSAFIAPAFIDIQIYGANKKLLAVHPTVDALNDLNEHCRKGGTAFCLPAVATNTDKIFHQAIDAIRNYWNQNGKGIRGLHIEGPWISKLKRGAHIESLIHSPSKKEVEELLDYGRDVIRMITLAPEVCDQEIIDLILSRGIIISAGHSNATYKEAIKAFENGITTVTHLYNAMSGLHHREPGLVGAAFDHNKVTASIIPDGHHVDYSAIRIAKQIMGERLFAITDAVTETDTGFYQHELEGSKYEAGGILSGSSLTMNEALKNLVYHIGIEIDEALRMCSYYPAKVLGMQNEFGKIEKGYKAAMVVLDERFEVLSLID